MNNELNNDQCNSSSKKNPRVTEHGTEFHSLKHYYIYGPVQAPVDYAQVCMGWEGQARVWSGEVSLGNTVAGRPVLTSAQNTH
jgi:hypothetical protein